MLGVVLIAGLFLVGLLVAQDADKSGLATVKLGERHKQAVEMRKQGDISGCLALLDELIADGAAESRMRASLLKLNTLLAEDMQEEAAAHVEKTGKEYSKQGNELANFVGMIAKNQRLGVKVERIVFESGQEVCKAILVADPENFSAWSVLAESHHALGNFKAAVKAQKKLVSICKDPSERPKLQKNLYVLEIMALPEEAREAFFRANKAAAQGQALMEQQKYEEALTETEAARKILAKNELTDFPLHATTLGNLGTLSIRTQDYGKATQYLGKSKAAYEKTVGKEHPSYYGALTSLASHYQKLGEYSQAEQLLVEARSVSKKIWGTESDYYGTDVEKLARFYLSRNQYAKAELLYKEYREIGLKMAEEGRPYHIASSGQLGNLYQEMGLYTKAIPFYIEAKSIVGKVLGKTHPHYVVTIEALLSVYENAGDQEKAETLHLELISIYQSTVGKEHLSYASSLNDFAYFYQSNGNYAKALPIFIEAKAIIENEMGKEHASYATCLNNLGKLYSEMGELEKADSAFLELRTVRETLAGKSDPLYVAALDGLANSNRLKGDFAQAEAQFKEAADIFEKTVGTDHPLYAISISKLAKFYVAQENYVEAERLLLQAQRLCEKTVGKEHPSYIESLTNLAALHQNKKEYAEAERHSLQAKNIAKQLFGEQDRRYTAAVIELAELREEAGDLQGAKTLYLEAKGIYQEVLGEGSQKYGRSLKRLAELYKKMGLESDSIELLNELAKLETVASRRELESAKPAVERKQLIPGKGWDAKASEAISAGDFSKLIEIRKNAVAEEKSMESGASIDALAKLAEAYEQNNDWEKAIETREEASKIAVARYSDEHWQTIRTGQDLADTKRISSFSKEAQQRWASVTDLESKALELFQNPKTRSDATELYQQVAQITAELFGNEHPRHAQKLKLAGIRHRESGNTSKAISFYKRSIKIYEDLNWQQYPAYGDTLSSLGEAFFSQGNVSAAEPLAKKSLEIYEAAFGKNHHRYAVGLNNLSFFYKSKGDFSQAVLLLEESLRIKEKFFGKEHSEYLLGLTHLADTYSRTNDFRRAEPMLLEGIEITEKKYGKKNDLYSSLLWGLAAYYQQSGDYERAEPMLQEVIQIRESVCGKQHPDYAKSLSNLGANYEARGMPEKALPLLAQAKKVLEQSLGKKHNDYAINLDRQASVLKSLGDPQAALPLYLEALEITEQTTGNQSLSFARGLNNLAGCYSQIGDIHSAELRYTQSLELIEKLNGKFHASTAAILDNLAILNLEVGRYETSKQFLEKSLKMKLILQGDNHPDCASTLTNLGDLHFQQKNYADGLILFQRANKIFEQTFGDKHPRYASSLAKIALAHVKMNNHGEAVSLFKKSLPLKLENLDRTACILSERQQMMMAQGQRHGLDSFVATCLNTEEHKNEAIPSIVAWKGVTLVRQRGIRLAAKNSATSEKFRQLQTKAQQLARHISAVPTENRDQWDQRLKTLSQEKEKLESELMKASSEFRDAMKRCGFDEVKAAIPKDGILIDFFELGSREMVASVIFPDAAPQMIDLGPVKPLGKNIDLWRSSFGMSTEGKQAGAAIRQQIWEPLMPFAEKANTVLVSTDGVLGRLPLGALPGKKADTYLLEEHRLAMIPVPQLLPALVKMEGKKQLTKELLLLGGVDYDGNQEPAASEKPESGRKKRPWERGAGTQWEFLQYSQPEVEAIGGLYRRLFSPATEAVVDLRGTAATESEFRKYAPQCMLLHLATHGYFAESQFKSSLSSELVSEANRTAGLTSMSNGSRGIVKGYSPGQLSGLVFAGANAPDSATGDDGIMTSDEIAFMPLDGVRLAVLSACQTGLGESAGGEGLLGIQRAFQVAGVDTTIGTLWAINDPATSHIMQKFYTNYLEKEMSLLDAMREAQLWALNNPKEVFRGDRRVGAKKDTQRLSPQFWAPFVLSGSWK